MSRKIAELVKKAKKAPKDRREMLALAGKKVFKDAKTKQGFKDQCDINKILKKAEIQGGLSHVEKYPEAVYGEFDGTMDLLTARSRLDKANAIFQELPAEVRGEFGHDALKFVAFANQPENVGKLAELIPAIAEPGSYFPNPVKKGGQGAGLATAPSEESISPVETTSEASGGSAAEASSEAV